MCPVRHSPQCRSPRDNAPEISALLRGRAVLSIAESQENRTVALDFGHAYGLQIVAGQEVGEHHPVLVLIVAHAELRGRGAVSEDEDPRNEAAEPEAT